MSILTSCAPDTPGAPPCDDVISGIDGGVLLAVAIVLMLVVLGVGVWWRSPARTLARQERRARSSPRDLSQGAAEHDEQR